MPNKGESLKSKKTGRAATVDFSVLIPTRNNIHFTERCLLSLFEWAVKDRISPDRVEILLLDSSSEDGLPELVAHYRQWDLRLIPCPEGADRPGIKGNLGARLARGRLLLFLHNDTEITGPLLQPLSQVLETRPDVGVAGNKHRLPNGLLHHAGMAFTRAGRPAYLYPQTYERHSLFRKSRPVSAVSFACAMVRRDEFLALGGFDERVAPGYEDVDLCLRYFHQGGKGCFLAARSTLIHHAENPSGIGAVDEAAWQDFMRKWQGVPLPSIDEIYAQDERESGMPDLRGAGASPWPDRGVFLERRAFMREALRGDARTVYFLFDEDSGAQSSAIHRLYEAFSRDFSSPYRIHRARPGDFPHFHDSEAFTITMAHYGPKHFWEARRFAERDLRLFAVNYELAGGQGPYDYWTEHILSNRFRLLATDEYSRRYLLQAGVSADRITVVPRWYPQDVVADPGRRHPLRGRIRYLINLNSDIVPRDQVAWVISAVCDAFAGRKNVELVIRDLGRRPDLLRRIAVRTGRMPHVVVHSGMRTPDAYSRLLRSVDGTIHVAPHDDSGALLEAAVFGVPIVAPIYGGAADFLPQAECLPLPCRLRPIGPGMDQKTLLLDERYLACKVDRRDLIRTLRDGIPTLRELRPKAAAKAADLRERFSCAGAARAVESCIRETAIGSGPTITAPAARLVLDAKLPGKVDFSILVNSYDRPGSIVPWLEHVTRLPDFGLVPTEVVILDDGSVPGYEALRAVFSRHAKNALRPFRLRLVRLDANSGNAIARNVLIDLAEGKRALFLGDDILPLPGMLRRHAEASERFDGKTLLLGHTEWHPRLRNNLVAEFATKCSGFQFNYEAIRNRSLIPLTNLFTSNVSFEPARVRTRGAYFEAVAGVSLFEDTLWGMALDREGFRLIYDRRAEALHDHEVSYGWLCDRSRVIGRTMYRYYALFPSTRAFTGIEDRLRFLRQALAASPLPRLDPGRYEERLREAIEVWWPRVGLAPSWEARQQRLRRLHSLFYEAYEYFVMKGLIASIRMSESRRERATSSCALLLQSRRRTGSGKDLT